jgi:hypothetical protein
MSAFERGVAVERARSNCAGFYQNVERGRKEIVSLNHGCTLIDTDKRGQGVDFNGGRMINKHSLPQLFSIMSRSWLVWESVQELPCPRGKGSRHQDERGHPQKEPGANARRWPFRDGTPDMDYGHNAKQQAGGNKIGFHGLMWQVKVQSPEWLLRDGNSFRSQRRGRRRLRRLGRRGSEFRPMPTCKKD